MVHHTAGPKISDTGSRHAVCQPDSVQDGWQRVVQYLQTSVQKGHNRYKDVLHSVHLSKPSHQASIRSARGPKITES